MRLRLRMSRFTRSTEKLVIGTDAAFTSSVSIDSAPTCQGPLRPSTRPPAMIGTTAPFDRPMRRL